MRTLFENEFAKITFEGDIKLLTIIWTSKKPSFEEYQKPFNVAVEFMKQNQVIDYISDVRNQGVVSPDFRKWLQEKALPEGAKYGLKRIAGIAEVNVFKQYYINNVFKSATKFGIPFKLFKTTEEAKQWFLEFE